jgi:plastocyanin
MPRLRAVAAIALGLAGPGPVLAAETARVEGRVTLATEGASLGHAGPIVVYLEIEQPNGGARRPARPPEIRQKNATFTPGFLAVQAGQTVRMPNDDDVKHNVYSYSGENEFDLGIYPAGETRSVTLDHPGVVEIHCSIHETMNGTIFVAPSPWYARVDAAGRFVIEDLPPGRYRLRTWSERLPRAEMFLRAMPGSTLSVNVDIGGS